MSWTSSSLQRWAACAALVGCVCCKAGLAATPTAVPDAFLTQTEALQLTDHPRFLQQLAQLNQQVSRLTPDQQWHLRFMNAWEAMYESDYAKSATLFRDIIQHSGNPLLTDHASALLMTQLGLTQHYTEAFELANRLAARLPQVTNAEVRFKLLLNLSSSLGLAGQTDLAIRYARMAMGAIPVGGSPCYPASMLVEALYNAHRLKSDSPELQQALAAFRWSRSRCTTRT